MTRTPCPDCAARGITRYPSCKCKRPHPRGRCHTCHRATLKRRTAASHDAYVCDTYGLAPGEYQELYEAQGGRCFICQRATGASRRLAVDHDHKTGLARGLLCKPCNRMLGLARDLAEFFERAIEYLRDPPAQRVLGNRYHKDFR
ncbi:endonuclease VII domain-containing protein [Glycomyces mayteni]|uniref:Endonuclease VII domain-containing protein n=1 Tax=Glycomyces mayteni TaxID=543887 RepID=A0ABW2D1Y3_9ACTN